MKKKVLNLILVTMLMIAQGISLTGCTEVINEAKTTFGVSNEDSTPVKNVAVIISPTANQHKPDISLAYDEIYDSCYSYGYKSCIVDDGSAYLAFEADLSKEDRTSGLSEQNKKLDAEAYVNSFIEKADTVQALTAEKDTIKSIRLAADSLADCEGEKTIVLIDNGISTTGIESFKTFIDFNADQCISALSESDYPILKNISIVWYSLGDTVSPQEELSNIDIKNLQDFWEKYFKKAGATDVRFSKKLTINQNVDNSSLPWVSTVKVTPEKSKTPDFKSLMKEVEDLPEDKRNDTIEDALLLGMKFDEVSAQFLPDSYEITDKAAVIKIMMPLASYLNNNTNKRVLLLGCTATVGSNDSCIVFSKKRSEALKSILVNDMNVESSQLITVGLGYENDFHIDDLNEDGTLNENAAKNRSVIFVAADSEIGKSYI